MADHTRLVLVHSRALSLFLSLSLWQGAPPQNLACLAGCMMGGHEEAVSFNQPRRLQPEPIGSGHLRQVQLQASGPLRVGGDLLHCCISLPSRPQADDTCQNHTITTYSKVPLQSRYHLLGLDGRTSLPACRRRSGGPNQPERALRRGPPDGWPQLRRYSPLSTSSSISTY